MAACPHCHGPIVKYYRPHQVMERLEISRRTLYYWIERGIIEVVRIPGTGTVRISAEALDKVLDAARRQTETVKSVQSERRDVDSPVNLRLG